YAELPAGASHGLHRRGDRRGVGVHGVLAPPRAPLPLWTPGLLGRGSRARAVREADRDRDDDRALVPDARQRRARRRAAGEQGRAAAVRLVRPVVAPLLGAGARARPERRDAPGAGDRGRRLRMTSAPRAPRGPSDDGAGGSGGFRRPETSGGTR